MSVLQNELIDIVVDTWKQLVDDEIEATSLYAVEGYPLAACIHIVGDWQGAATVVMQNEIAEHLAKAMFSVTSAEELSENHIADALSELVNIVGGIIKANLEGHNALSLPVIVRGGMDIVGSEIVFVQGFETSVGQFEVGLYTHSKKSVERISERFNS